MEDEGSGNQFGLGGQPFSGRFPLRNIPNFPNQRGYGTYSTVARHINFRPPQVAGLGSILTLAPLVAIDQGGYLFATLAAGFIKYWLQLARPPFPLGSYSAVEIGTLGGSVSHASAINNLGQVVGSSLLVDDATVHPYIREVNGSITDLGLLPGYASGVASDVNDDGQVAGWCWSSRIIDTWDDQHGFSWQDGTMRALPRLTGDTIDQAYAINGNGQIAGESWHGRGDTYGSHGYFESGGTALETGTFGIPNNAATALNNVGQVVGMAGVPPRESVNPQPWHAFLFSEGRTKDLGTLGGVRSVALDINDHGVVVGYSEIVGDDNDSESAFSWNAGTMSYLGTLGRKSAARAINDAGIIVGLCYLADPHVTTAHAAIWVDGWAYDLNDLIEPANQWLLLDAVDINNHGQILVEAEFQSDSRAVSLILTPS